MTFFQIVLSWSSFSCLTMVVLVSPWFFGAWEMWWFWPFALFLLLSFFFFSLRLLCYLPGARPYPFRDPGISQNLPGWLPGNHTGDESRDEKHLPPSIRILLGSYLAFLAYAFARFLQADVFMDAERSFLLFLTPFLIGVQIVFGFNRRQFKILTGLLLSNLFLLGLYGLVNHVLNASRWVLWRPGFPQYVDEVRATGSFFCPDHFAGAMEMALALGLGLILARDIKRYRKALALFLCLVAVTSVILSKSRGGGLTLLVMAGAVLMFGFAQWPPGKRWLFRGMALAALLAGLGIFIHVAEPYVDRFQAYFGWSQTRGRSLVETKAHILDRMQKTSRWQMMSAAVRAWQREPVWGIGPGMHAVLYPHFAASPDGDRELGVWPTFTNHQRRSNAVHNDWLQLLEEYGGVGFVIFLTPFFALLFALVGEIREETTERRHNDWEETGRTHYAAILGALLALTAMAFHSLGDFNLQIPANTWLFAVILTLPLGQMLAGSELVQNAG